MRWQRSWRDIFPMLQIRRVNDWGTSSSWRPKPGRLFARHTPSTILQIATKTVVEGRVDRSCFAIVQRPSDQPTAHPRQTFVVSPLTPHRLTPGDFVPSLVPQAIVRHGGRSVHRPPHHRCQLGGQQPHPCKNHRPPGERCRAMSSNSCPSASVGLSQATESPSCGLWVRRQLLVRENMVGLKSLSEEVMA